MLLSVFRLYRHHRRSGMTVRRAFARAWHGARTTPTIERKPK